MERKELAKNMRNGMAFCWELIDRYEAGDGKVQQIANQLRSMLSWLEDVGRVGDPLSPPPAPPPGYDGSLAAHVGQIEVRLRSQEAETADLERAVEQQAQDIDWLKSESKGFLQVGALKFVDLGIKELHRRLERIERRQGAPLSDQNLDAVVRTNP